MNINKLYPDPFATLVQLTAGALRTLPARAYQPRAAEPPPRSLLDRLDAWIWHQRQRDIERALADCADIYEVERRLRGETQVFHRYS